MEYIFLSALIMMSVGFCANELQYTIENSLKEPYFNETTNFTITNGSNCDTVLIRYMEMSVLDNSDTFTSLQVKFTSSYGYYVNEINGVFANWSAEQIYWSIWNQTTYLPKGVSEYIPTDGEHIIFRLVNGTDGHNDTDHTDAPDTSSAGKLSPPFMLGFLVYIVFN